METVTSREYKVMLRPSAFDGGPQRCLEAASGFWNEFSAAIATTVRDREGDLRTMGRERMIRFYDTRARLLNEHRHIFRERLSTAQPEREVTLKFRHQDRYFCQDRNMRAAEADRGKTKFEEDIKPVFETLYSFSTTQQISGKKKLNKLKDVTLLYPGLAEQLDHYENDEEIEVIGGFTARELVVEGARFQIGKNPKLDSECGLILWYDLQGDDQKPVVAEFSFRYGNRNADFEGNAARRAYEVFQILQESLKGWLDPDSKTKTAFVYG